MDHIGEATKKDDCDVGHSSVDLKHSEAQSIPK